LSTARGSGHARQRLRDKGDDCGLVVADGDDELLLLLGWRPVGGGRQLLLTVTCVDKEARRGTVMLYNAKDICWGVVFVGTVRFEKKSSADRRDAATQILVSVSALVRRRQRRGGKGGKLAWFWQRAC